MGFNGGGVGCSNWRYKGLDLPLFDGTNPDGWILRAERYFNFYRLTEEEKNRGHCSSVGAAGLDLVLVGAP